MSGDPDFILRRHKAIQAFYAARRRAERVRSEKTQRLEATMRRRKSRIHREYELALAEAHRVFDKAEDDNFPK